VVHDRENRNYINNRAGPSRGSTADKGKQNNDGWGKRKDEILRLQQRNMHGEEHRLETRIHAVVDRATFVRRRAAGREVAEGGEPLFSSSLSPLGAGFD